MTKQTNALQTEDSAQRYAFLLQALPKECIRTLNQISLNLEYSQRCLKDRDGQLPAEDLRQSLLDAGAAANRLDRTLDCLFQFLACAQGGPAPCWEPVELCGELRGICADREAIYKNIGVRVTLDCGGAETLYAAADRAWLECICLQLFSNALRACDKGGQVELRLCPGEQEHRLYVTDDGCGLPEAAPMSKNREHFVGGAGLGLRLCREYCRLLGWTLELTPRPEGGTCAVLHIPVQEAAAPPNGPLHFRSGVWEAKQREDSLRHAVRRELRSVPGLETAEFELP